jgi:hypothetical protein
MKFQSIQRDEVPKGRPGKHKRIVALLLNQLERLPSGNALKVPLSALPDSKANIRAALNRATHQKGVTVATSSDSSHLYLWKAEQKS